MPKQRTRRRPEVQSDNGYLKQEEHRLCQGRGCRNVVAVWTRLTHCGWCRKSLERR